MTILSSPTFNSDRQKGRITGPGGGYDALTPGDMVGFLQPMFVAQTIYKSGSTWYAKDHTVASGGSDTVITGGHYDVPFLARQVQVGVYPDSTSVDGNGYLLHFDTPLALNIIEQAYGGTAYIWRPTRIILDASTTCTKITIYG